MEDRILKRMLGVDFGEARIGLAVSDALGWMAQGLETIKWKGSLPYAVEQVAKVAVERDVGTIVVGYPRNLNGTEGPRTERTQQFMQLLAEALPQVELVKWDEWLTSVSAHRVMREMGVKSGYNKGMVDRIAAEHILQGYIDSINNKMI